MTVSLKEFGSASEILKFVDQAITDTKNALNGYMHKLEDIRELAEKSRIIREVIYKYAGKRSTSESEVFVSGVNVIFDAKSVHELSVLEEAVRGQQGRLVELQRTRENLKWADQIGDAEGVRFIVLEKDGVPKKILVRFTLEY
jgi:hypothetical protein